MQKMARGMIGAFSLMLAMKTCACFGSGWAGNSTDTMTRNRERLQPQRLPLEIVVIDTKTSPRENSMIDDGRKAA
jgi:hypothetical protein